MKTRRFDPKTWILVSYGLLTFFICHQAQAQNIDMDACMSSGVVHTFEMIEGAPFSPANINVVNADTPTLFWLFDFPPPVSANGDVVESNGVTVTIPVDAGDPEGTPVASTEAAVVSSTGAHTAGEFNFQITVTESDASDSCQQEYEVKIIPPLDLVLLLDHSGSMTTITPTGNTRWRALRDAVEDLFLTYEGLLSEHPADQVAITYFDSDLLPSSGCCSALTAINAGITSTIVGELDNIEATDGPSGSTGMGSGLIDAVGKLTSTTKARTVLLFTDGRQNVDPEIVTTGNGFNDATPWVLTGANDGDIKVFTIGIDNPNGDYLSTLQSLASNHRGSLNLTEDGDLSTVFIDTFVDMLSEFSPQLVARSTHNIAKTGPTPLESFPLNNRVSKLLIQVSVDRKMELPQVAQFLSRIRVQKDGTDVLGQATPRLVGNFTNTVQLEFDFDDSISGGPATFKSGGNWVVGLQDMSNLGQSQASVTVIAEDHRLDFPHDKGNDSPLVNESIDPSLTLSWIGQPITDATVRAVVGVPGTDIGDLLSEAQNVDPTSVIDAPLPGTQKYNNLFSNDPNFRAALARQDNVITLNHAGNGVYEGSFNGLDVAGIYNIVYLISGNHPDAGDYQRFATESFYTSFSDIDLSASNVIIQSSQPNALVFDFTPTTSYGSKIGPAMSTAFAVDNPNVQITSVDDFQDGTYRVTLAGDVSDNATISVLGKDVYSGSLDQISSEKTLMEKICDFLASFGLPCWVFWIILLIVIAILVWYYLRKKNP